jgi:2-methylcitrate dehydratase PrpD
MLTHAVIEATRELRERHDLHARDVQAITARVERLAERVCTYDTPTSGMEAKFSVPFATALALLGRDSGRPDAYSDAAVTDPDITVLLDRVRVEFKDELPAMTAEVELRLTDGRVLRQTWDAGQPARDVEAERLARKFLTLAGPILGEQRAEQLRGAIEDLEGIRDVATIRGLLSAD